MLLLLPVLIPLVCGGYLLFHPAEKLKSYCYGTMTATTLCVLALPFFNLGSLTLGEFPYGVAFSLEIDLVSIFFSFLFVLVWFVVLEYALDYLAHDPEKNRFFAFYLATLGAMIGVSYAENLVTLYLFFEMVGLMSMSLVGHDRSEEALRASRKYLFYSVAGACMGLTAIFYFFSLGVPQDFTPGGIPELAEAGDRGTILAFTLIATIGFGCKAGLFPLHGWLKTAHPLAPAPASAVLSGITTKAGVIAILRLLYYVVGEDVIVGTFVQEWGLTLSIFTIFLGSGLAYREKVLKARLAYSTVSQVSYVIFALFLFHEMAFVGAMLQVLFHAMAKTNLFMSAGTMIHETGKHRVDELVGIGHQLPTPLLTFTIAGMSLVGLPFTGGFVSKWYIASGGSAVGAETGVVVLIISALLTAGYLFPISTRGYLEQGGSEKKIHLRKSVPLLTMLILVFGTFPLPLIYVFELIAESLGLGGGL